MHSAIVGPAGVDLFHVGWLRVGAEIGIVFVGRAGVFHVANASPRRRLHQHLAANQPARLLGRLSPTPLPHEHSENI